MASALPYFRALEAQELWEGDIQLTVLVTLFPSVAAAVANPDASSTTISTQLTSSNALGGVVLTDHMVYVLRFDALPSEAATPSFQIVLEDVVDAITHLDLFENNEPSPTGSQVVFRLRTLSDDAIFTLKDASLFDNIDLAEVVHYFGIIPSVHVTQQLYGGAAHQGGECSPDAPRCAPPPQALQLGPDMPPRERSLSSQQMSRKSGESVESTQPNWEDCSPPKKQNDKDTALVLESFSRVLTLFNSEAQRRMQVINDEGSDRSLIVLRQYQRLVDTLQFHFMEELDARAANEVSVAHQISSVVPVQQFSNVDEASLQQLLESHERLARQRLQKYLTITKKESSAKARAAEREFDQREALERQRRLEKELSAVVAELHDLESALFASKEAVQSLTAERNDLKKRESVVVEKARKREAELHQQIKELRGNGTVQ